MKIDFIIIQNFTNHLVQGKSQSRSEETLENYHLIIFRCRSGFFPGKMNQLLLSFSEVASFIIMGISTSEMVDSPKSK
jgi:hypothetical protein